mgnify:CR=1 FL=1
MIIILEGPDGSGKSTLMNMLGCLDVPTSGTYMLHGQDVSHMSDDELSDIRNKEIGFIFQGFNLIPNLTALENVELALQICKEPLDAKEVLEEVGLGDRMNNFPAQLSGGEQQRHRYRQLHQGQRLFLHPQLHLYGDQGCYLYRDRLGCIRNLFSL